MLDKKKTSKNHLPHSYNIGDVNIENLNFQPLKITFWYLYTKSKQWNQIPINYVMS